MERLHLSGKALLQYRNNQIEKFVKLLKKAKKKPRPETIHKIRTTIRRLNILMNKKEIKKLMKALGRERDLHVAQELALSFGLNAKNIKHKNKIQKNSAFKEIKKFDLKVLKFADDSEMLLQFKRAMGKLGLKLETFSSDSLDEKKMHEFRILLKKIRYGLEAIGQSSPQLEEMQEQLGKIHDIDVLQSMKGKKQILEIIKKMMIEDIQQVYQSIYKLMYKKLNAI
jgi:CHAD domain-containing protein